MIVPFISIGKAILKVITSMEKLSIKDKKEPLELTWLFLILLFIIAFIYFYLKGNYVLFFQEQQSLFIFSPEFLHNYFFKPGGLLEFAGKFLTQFYAVPVAGAALIAFFLILPGIIMVFINRRMGITSVLSLLLAIIPSALLLLMQTHYYHMMTYNIGIAFVLAYFLFSVSSNKKFVSYSVIIIFPFFWYIAGAYALIFASLYIVFNLLYKKGIQKIIDSLFIIIATFLTFVIFDELLFSQPDKLLLTYPFPSINDTVYRFFMIFLACYIILYPVLCNAVKSINTDKGILRKAGLITSIVFILFTVYTLVKRYNPQTANVINIEKMAFQEKWNDLLRTYEMNPSKNLIGEYFYNIALTETDQLCDRMFFGEHNFGVKSLFLPWDEKYLNWGAYIFYAIGLINEAHRWAYEEMVVYGPKPQNMEMLVKTNLINENFKMAEKYINILKKTLFYKRWAEEYEKLIGDTTGINLYPSLGKKVKIIPHNDFFIFLESPEENLPLLIEGNPNNKMAFEYLTAWLLLNKDVETVVENIPKMKELGYTNIPRHIEEAVMIYFNSKGVMPDMGGMTISYGTMERFNRYVTMYTRLRQKSALKRENIDPEFKNTYWFFYHFF